MTRTRQPRVATSITLAPEAHEGVRLLAEVQGLPLSRFIDQIIRARLETLTPLERAAMAAVRAKEAAAASGGAS